MCGIFGVRGHREAAAVTHLGLYSLQHRGQESAGIAVSDGAQIMVFKDMGLVPQVFDEPVLNTLRGHIAIGHCRYSTSGSSVWNNAQPTFRIAPSESACDQKWRDRQDRDQPVGAQPLAEHDSAGRKRRREQHVEAAAHSLFDQRRRCRHSE